MKRINVGMWHIKLCRLMKLFFTVTIFSAMMLALGGCGRPNGNDNADINAAVSSVEERYGINLTVKKKARFPGGVKCDVTVSCDELPGKELRVFKFDDLNSASCDYIFVKYSDEAYNKICDVINEVLPGVKIVVDDFSYNHFESANYDKNTTFEDYLQNNSLRINIIIAEEYSRDKILNTYCDAAQALLDEGINACSLSVYCMESLEAAEAVKTYDHIPDPQEFKPPYYSEDVVRYAYSSKDLKTTLENKDDHSIVIIGKGD